MKATVHLSPVGRQALPWKVVLLLCIAIFAAVRGMAQSAVVCPPNIDFNFGNLGLWNCYTGTSSTLPGSTAASFTGSTFTGPITGRHTVMTGTGVDRYGGFPVVAPGGFASLKLGNDTAGGEAERVRYFVHVPIGFNNYSFSFRFAVVFEQGAGHADNVQPSFQIAAYDSATNQAISQGCAWQTFYSGGGMAGFQQSTVAPNPWYLPWTSGTLNLSGQGGKTIVVEVTAFDCTAGGHFGYGYFDVISCGQFEAALTTCDLDKNIVTLEAPVGYASYQWFAGPTISGAPISTLRSFNLTSVPVTPTYYYCVLTPYSGPRCNDTIRTRLISNFNINASPDTVCNSLGKPLQLSVTGTGGLGVFNYSWLPHPTLGPGPDPMSGRLLPPAVNGGVTAAPMGSGLYVVTLTDSSGCFKSDTVVVQNPGFKLDLGPDVTTCLGTPLQLNPSLTPGPGYVFSWSPGANLSTTTALKPVYTPVATGTETYVLRVDSGVCAVSDTIRIRTLPDTFSTIDAAVCARDPFNPQVQTDPQYQDVFTYLWAPATYITPGTGSNRQPLIQADTSISYTVTMRYPGCPDVIRPLNVRVEPMPRVELGGDSIAKCADIPLILTADVQPAWFSNYTYAWRSNTHLDYTNLPIARYTGNVDTTLVVTVRTPLGCRGADSIRVMAYQGNFGAVTPEDTAICPRNTFRMTASGGVSYRWSPGAYLSDSTSADVVASPQTSTDYTVYVTDRNGCVDTLPVSIQVYSEAAVSLPDSAVLYPGQSVQMNPGGNGFYFDWFPTAGLNNPGISNPVASPSVNTRYFVTATTEAGCIATDSIYVMVHQKSAIDMPNAFAPGSGLNREFRVAHAGLASLRSFRVYNRWGALLFETKSIDKGWDGSFNGEAQPTGVYVYTVEAVGVEGQVLTKSGNVTLIR